MRKREVDRWGFWKQLADLPKVRKKDGGWGFGKQLADPLSYPTRLKPFFAPSRLSPLGSDCNGSFGFWLPTPHTPSFRGRLTSTLLQLLWPFRERKQLGIWKELIILVWRNPKVARWKGLHHELTTMGFCMLPFGHRILPRDIPIGWQHAPQMGIPLRERRKFQIIVPTAS